ncbi:MAG: hypothetical protein ACREFZ_04780 [Acetobacteraceae bacterium]
MSEIIPPAEILARYRAEAQICIVRYVSSVLAPAFPGAAPELIKSACAFLTGLSERPDGKRARAEFAAQLARIWSGVIQLPELHRRQVEQSLSEFALQAAKLPVRRPGKSGVSSR